MALLLESVIEEVLNDSLQEAESISNTEEQFVEAEEETCEAIGREEVVKSKNVRKRVRDESLWQRNSNKKKRACGEEYVSTANTVVPARAVGEPCSCRRKCFDKVGISLIQKIYDGFSKLADKDKQDAYLFSLISATPVARHRPRSNSSRNHCRSKSYYYRVKAIDPERDVVVCKRAFLSIHGITEKRLRRLCDHVSMGECTPPTDKRGKHKNHPQIDNDTVQKIRSHIESFPTQESHYSRSDNRDKRFLPEALNIRRMYNLYLEKHEPDQLERIQQGLPFTGVVKEHFYR